MLEPKPNFHKDLQLDNSPNFGDEVREALFQNKIVTITNVPQNYKMEDLDNIYSDASDKIGEIIPMDENEEGNKTGNRWIDIKFTPEKRMQSFLYSDTQQPLHTDSAYESQAPDVTFFYCYDPADIGGATTFFDSKDLIECLSHYEPDLLEKLETTSLNFSKGDDFKTAKIISYDEEGPLLNWNYFRVSKENSKEALDLAERFHNFLELKIVDSGILYPLYLKSGECVFFNDKRLLHGRNAYFGSRHLKKGGIKYQLESFAP